MHCGCAHASDSSAAPSGAQPAARAPSPAYAEARARAESIGPIASPLELYWVLEPLVRGQRIELAHVTLLDASGYVVLVREIGRGTRISVEVPIATAVRAAHRAGVRYLVLSHNHPSGDPWPSVDDARLTADAERAAAHAGLVMLDHLVVGRDAFYSFREGDQWTIRS